MKECLCQSCLYQRPWEIHCEVGSYVCKESKNERRVSVVWYVNRLARCNLFCINCLRLNSYPVVHCSKHEIIWWRLLTNNELNYFVYPGLCGVSVLTGTVRQVVQGSLSEFPSGKEGFSLSLWVGFFSFPSCVWISQKLGHGIPDVAFFFSRMIQPGCLFSPQCVSLHNS